jgi:hypothetical protein
MDGVVRLTPSLEEEGGAVDVQATKGNGAVAVGRNVE